MKFLLKRVDTGKVVRHEFKEDEQIFDLLETCRSLLEFAADAILSVHLDGDRETLSEAKVLGDLKEVKMLLVNDRRLEANEETKRKADANERDNRNMKTAKESRDNIGKNLKHKDDDLEGKSRSFSSQFSEERPRERVVNNSLLENLRTQSQTNSANTASSNINEDEELTILNKKLRAEGLDGFLYEIVPEDYVDQNESTYKELSFSSEREMRSTQSQVISTSEISSSHAEGSFSAWGVSVSAHAGHSKATNQHEGNKTEKMEKTTVAIVTRTAFHQMKKFRVRVRLDERTVKDAKEILKAPMHDKLVAISEFTSKYCSFLYTGQFSAGGWFRTVATASSTEAMEFKALEKEASAKTETHWALSAGGYGATAAAGQHESASRHNTEKESQQSNNSTVSVSIKKESAPGNTSSEDDLENKIKSAKNLTVFPIIGAKSDHFTQVYEIMKIQAEETHDKDLKKVSDILRLYMKGDEF